MSLKIVKWPSPILTVTSEVVTESLDQALLTDMHHTMKNALGVGLSAIQVNVPKAFFILDIGNGMEVFVNPRIVQKNEKTVEITEGCLSVPGIYEKIFRPQSVDVSYLDGNMQPHTATLTGLRCQIFCHEEEHLRGDMFLNHLPKGRKDAVRAIVRRRS